MNQNQEYSEMYLLFINCKNTLFYVKTTLCLYVYVQDLLSLSMEAAHRSVILLPNPKFHLPNSNVCSETKSFSFTCPSKGISLFPAPTVQQLQKKIRVAVRVTSGAWDSEITWTYWWAGNGVQRLSTKCISHFALAAVRFHHWRRLLWLRLQRICSELLSLWRLLLSPLVIASS